MGESLKGRDKKILPLVYSLAFYGASEEEIASGELTKEDVAVVKRAQEHFGIIYRRFIKQCYGWKLATRVAFGPLYGLSVLRENVTHGFQ